MGSLYDLMTVDLPEVDVDGIRVERFEARSDTIEAFRQAIVGRPVADGTYTKLVVDGKLWMSDTPAEKKDHVPALQMMRLQHAKRVLINGLGIGMVLKAALSFDFIEHIDVIEIDQRIIDVIGPHYNDPRVTIHHADAYEQMRRWPTGARWDVAWHDIWRQIDIDNLPHMERLHRSYGHRVGWQGSWSKELLIRMRAQERKWEKMQEEFLS